MGIPKFFRWISDRYPKINTIIADGKIPEVDNLYLDMNGILHNCSHPSDGVSETMTDRQIIEAIFDKLDRIISTVIRPKKLLYLAIDGVAPRAKLNQQRARRFRAAQERTEEIQKKISTGAVVADIEFFDSSCITPGTEFMSMVNQAIHWYIRKRIRDDPNWRHLQVIFSGHDVPGEGEHKIMQFIREERAKPEFEPNQRHCMYGLDADLIMLSLSTHEPHFMLLREVVQYGNAAAKAAAAADPQYQLMHLSVLRDYLHLDFGGTSTELNRERLIDDFTFLTFLVGNDFLPHLPSLYIGDDAFDIIFGAYKEIQLESPGFIVEDGTIADLRRFERLCAKIGAMEPEIMRTNEAAHARKQQRYGGGGSRGHGGRRGGRIGTDQREASLEAAYQEAVGGISAIWLACSPADSRAMGTSDPAHAIVKETKDYRGRYYFDKLGLVVSDPRSQAQLGDLFRSYLEGLMWCLAYYLKGCISWTWYFPYHYGPMLQDMRDLESVAGGISFELGQPFRPFQQLLGCLPPASKTLLPRPYQWIMTSDSSPVKEFYPVDFAIDMDGKANPWEGVVLLDFIDEKRLLEAEAVHCGEAALTSDERARNAFGRIHRFRFSAAAAASGSFSAQGLSAILAVLSDCRCEVAAEAFSIAPSEAFRAELVPGTTLAAHNTPTLTRPDADLFVMKQAQRQQLRPDARGSATGQVVGFGGVGANVGGVGFVGDVAVAAPYYGAAIPTPPAGPGPALPLMPTAPAMVDLSFRPGAQTGAAQSSGGPWAGAAGPRGAVAGTMPAGLSVQGTGAGSDRQVAFTRRPSGENSSLITEVKVVAFLTDDRLKAIPGVSDTIPIQDVVEMLRACGGDVNAAIERFFMSQGAFSRA